MAPRGDHHHQRKARTQALPLPATIFVLGTVTSFILWQWIRSTTALVTEFRRDAATVAFQVTSRVSKDVQERYVPSFIELAGDALNVASWTTFTDEWIARNPQGVIAWAPLVRGGNATDFDASVEEAYPDRTGGLPIYRLGFDGSIVFVNDLNATEDMLPALYVNPVDDFFLGIDLNQAELGYMGDRMTETNDTVLSDVLLSALTRFPIFTVAQPAFGVGKALGSVVGCTAKALEVQQFVLDTLEAAEFSTAYTDADFAVFLQDGNNTQLLFDLEKHPDGLADAFLAGDVTPSSVEKRGSKSMSSVVHLVGDNYIVVVSSFKPAVSNFSIVSLVCGCAASLFVALLVYGSQVLVFSYKRGLEKATTMSRFKSRFVADMSHEIRTPLNGIIGTIEMLGEERLSEDGRELLHTAQSCAMILMGIVNDALDFSKIEAGLLKVEARPTLLRKMFVHTMKILQSTYRSPEGEAVGDVRLRLDVDETVPTIPVLADEARIRQVVVNLVSNAFRFTDKGSVSVNVRLEPSLPCIASAATPSRSRQPLDRPNSAGGVDNELTTTEAGDGSIFPANRRSGVKTGSAVRTIRGLGCGGGGNASGGALSARQQSRLLPTNAISSREWAPCAGQDDSSIRSMIADVNGGRDAKRLSGFFSADNWEKAGKERGTTREGGGPEYAKNFVAAAPTHHKARLFVEVTDTGVGMTQAQTARLFSAFSQVHSTVDRGVGGTGLGLAISKSLCESMGGSIGVRSNPGQGSTFYFSVLVGTPASAIATSSNGRDGPTPAEAPTNDLHSSEDGTLTNLSSASAVLPSSLATPMPSPGLGNTPAQAPAAKRISQEWGLAAGLRGDTLRGRNDSGTARRHSRYGAAQEEWLGEQAGAADAPPAGLIAVAAAAATVEQGMSDDAGDHHRFPTQPEPRRSEAATAPGVSAGGRRSDERNVPSCVLHLEELWATAVEAARASGSGALSPPASMSAGAGGVSRPRILVVDDQRVNRMLVRRMLQGLDADVALEVDGAKAAQACRESTYDMILMDVMMPVMGGLEATREIRAEGGRNRTTPIILVTANPMISASSGQVGVMDTLYKPITRNALFGALAKWSKEEHVVWMGDAWSKHVGALTTD